MNIITHEYQRDLPGVKSINYLMGIWLQQKIRQQKATDVLYYKDGLVSEFPRANVFIVTKDGTVATPSHNVLMGVTRMKLLELMHDKFQVEVRPVHIDEVRSAAEVFMTSTTKRLLPVNAVDGKIIGEGSVGPVTTLLHKLFMDAEDQLVKLLPEKNFSKG